jgi:hypothetical protein
MSSVESSGERGLAIACTTAHICSLLPASCMQRLRVSASRHPSHRFISDHMSTNVWPLQHHHREALGAALKWEEARVGFRPSQLSSTPRSCATAQQHGYALIDAASETVADAIAKVCRLSNVSDLAIAPTCAISRSLPRMAAHETYPDLSRLSGQVAVSGGSGSARTGGTIISSLSTSTRTPGGGARKCCSCSDGSDWMSCLAVIPLNRGLAGLNEGLASLRLSASTGISQGHPCLCNGIG